MGRVWKSIMELKPLKEKINDARKIALKHPSQAFEMANSLYKEACTSKARSEEAASLFVMALACRSMTKLDCCYSHAYDAHQIYEELDDQAGKATTLNLIGIVYFYNTMYEHSLEKFLKALQFVVESDDHATLSRIYNNIGEVYRKVGNMEEALSAYGKALEVSVKYSFMEYQAVILENMGHVYFSHGDLKKSFDYYLKSYDMLIDLDDVTSLAELENKIGKIYFLQRNFDQAKHYSNRALKRLEEIENKYYIIEVLIDLAEYEEQVDEFAFLAYLNKAIDHAEAIQERQQLSRIFSRLSVFYESKGQYNLSLDYFKKYHQVEQVIESTVMSKKLEIIKVELNKLYVGRELEKVSKMNGRLEQEISTYKKMVHHLEQINTHLSEEVLYDDLTQLTNRKGVTKYLTKVWGNEEDSSTNLAFLLIDIDHFKRYNDFHGHIQGDFCLKQVADCMKKVLGNREGILGRFGGEEFICFLKDIDLEGVIQFTEDLREAVEASCLLYRYRDHPYPVTISVGGVHGKRDWFQNMQELYVIADEELYKAKSNGRNQVKIQVYDTKLEST